MGNRKLKWTAEEEETLKAGVAKYGAGKWKSILADPELKLKLAYRSNVDLKDKWRNLGVTVGQGSGVNTMTPDGQATAISVLSPKNGTSSPVVTKDDINEITPNGQAIAISVLPPKTETSSSVVTKNNINETTPNGKATAISVLPPKNGPTYTGMILEALSSIKDRNGSGFSSILEFIKKKYEVPQNFRRKLSSKLGKLVKQGKLEKVHKRYKIKQASLAIKKVPSSKRKAVRPKPRQKPKLCFSSEAVGDAAKTIANHIAEAEHKSFIAAEAINESERISRMADDSDAVVMHLKEIIEQLEKTKQTSSRAAEAINEPERVARMPEDSDAATMRLNEIFKQWEIRSRLVQ